MSKGHRFTKKTYRALLTRLGYEEEILRQLWYSIPISQEMLAESDKAHLELRQMQEFIAKIKLRRLRQHPKWFNLY